MEIAGGKNVDPLEWNELKSHLPSPPPPQKKKKKKKKETGSYLSNARTLLTSDDSGIVVHRITCTNIQQHFHDRTTKRNTFYKMYYNNFIERHFQRTMLGGQFRLHGTETRDSRVPRWSNV